jgi:hypothetical protein
MAAGARIRWLLFGILACLAFLVFRNVQRGDAGRYVVHPLRPGSPVLVRTDTATGESWKLELHAGGERWIPIPGPGETPAERPSLRREPDVEAEVSDPLDPTVPPRPLAQDEIKALANAILGDELSPDIRMWAVGQLAVTPDRRATLALSQLLGVVDDPQLLALIREALKQRDDPLARAALERNKDSADGS